MAMAHRGERQRMTSYTYRLNALEQDTTLILVDGALRVERDGRIERRPLSQVAAVRLSFNPSRVDRDRYDCRLEMRDGATVLARSTTYRGFASFESQADGYGAFVRALHGRLAPHGDISYERGDSSLRFYGSMGCFVTSLVLLLVVLIATGLLFVPWIAVAKLLVLLFSVPLILKYARRNRPRSYDPAAVPDDMLPGIED